MRLVIVESPFAGDVDRNVAYARAALRDCLMRGEAPIASHLLYTQPGVLRDERHDERALGIAAGLAWGKVAEASVIYADLGISPGMIAGIERAVREGRAVEVRTLAQFAKVPFDVLAERVREIVAGVQLPLRLDSPGPMDPERLRDMIERAEVGTVEPAPVLVASPVVETVEEAAALDAAIPPVEVEPEPGDNVPADPPEAVEFEPEGDEPEKGAA